MELVKNPVVDVPVFSLLYVDSVTSDSGEVDALKLSSRRDLIQSDMEKTYVNDRDEADDFNPDWSNIVDEKSRSKDLSYAASTTKAEAALVQLDENCIKWTENYYVRLYRQTRQRPVRQHRQTRQRQAR